MLDKSAQAGRHTNRVRGLDLYETPRIAVEALLAVEQLPEVIWEPAAGRGAITRVLEAAGFDVISSDIVGYEFPLDFVADFLTCEQAPRGCTAALTNPPYQHAEAFVRHALKLAPNVFMLLRLAFLESRRRADIFGQCGLRTVHVFRSRLPMMHRDGWNGPRASSAIAFAWFCWTRGYRGRPTLSWL
ncbi:MAG: hypothetical protein ACLQJR_19115 [Stellaceae bacterium]